MLRSGHYDDRGGREEAGPCGRGPCSSLASAERGNVPRSCGLIGSGSAGALEIPRRSSRIGRWIAAEARPSRMTEVPDEAVGAGGVEGIAAEPHADERADLVAEEGDAVEHAHVARAEEQRSRARPSAARSRARGTPSRRRTDRPMSSVTGNSTNSADGHGAREVDRRQHQLLGQPAAQIAGAAASRRC